MRMSTGKKEDQYAIRIEKMKYVNEEDDGDW